VEFVLIYRGKYILVEDVLNLDETVYDLNLLKKELRYNLLVK